MPELPASRRAASTAPASLQDSPRPALRATDTKLPARAAQTPSKPPRGHGPRIDPKDTP